MQSPYAVASFISVVASTFAALAVSDLTGAQIEQPKCQYHLSTFSERTALLMVESADECEDKIWSFLMLRIHSAKYGS
jgi:hypothetical protein